MSGTTNGWRLLYDREDYELLEVIRPYLAGNKSYRQLRRLFDPFLHPRGIKELAALRPLRLGCAVFDLLSTLEGGSPAERLRTLRAARDEVLHNESLTLLRNTARVLLQTMKELVRATGDERRMLELAHDFRGATAGKPRMIRRLLTANYLLEMPEAWNQLAFDHHVHDANSKGRKTPTHLVMDAWIKGITHIVVIYYNHVTQQAAAELLEAASIMGLHVRIGVETSAVHRGRYAQLIWAPRGFHSWRDFVAFLEEPGTREFMQKGAEVSEYRQRYLLQLFDAFNARHRPAINERFGLDVPPLGERQLLEHVGPGQCSMIHLGEFIHGALQPRLQARVSELRREVEATGCSAEVRARAAQQVAAMNRLVPEAIIEGYLRPESNPDLPDPRKPATGDGVPEFLRLDVRQMLDRFERAPRGNRTILNPSGLSAADVLEVLYDAGGLITHLELFNLKDWAEGAVAERDQVSRIRQALNGGNVVEAKRVVLEVLARVEASDLPDREERVEKLRAIVADIPRFVACYRHSHLKSYLGSDSTSRSRRSQGMGLVVVPTLESRARHQVRREPGRRLPVRTVPCRHASYSPRHSDSPLAERFYAWARGRRGLWRLGHTAAVEWSSQDNSTVIVEKGNIAALGGVPEEPGGKLTLGDPQRKAAEHEGCAGAERGGRAPLRWRYLDTRVQNALKVLTGFLPAFATFALTKDWWVLAYLGAPIWFAITGLRNVVQSVVGGGGLRRSPLLSWNDFISWSRVADSLFFTGFSVPLLDFLVKTLLLQQTLNITTAHKPVLLYAAIAAANGLYISSHNLLRGLPTAAVVGNLFRTVLSIPIAVGLNAAIYRIAVVSGATPEVALAGLQLWAAVISKASSDVVAGVIEGLADRARNLSQRSADYRDKREHLQEVIGRVAVLFPERDLGHLLADSKSLVRSLKAKDEQLLRQAIINALDLMYFALYQPRGRIVLRRMLAAASEEERRLIVAAQHVLERKRVVSKLLLDGLVGKQFDRALAFYLARVDGYLADLGKIAGTTGPARVDPDEQDD